MILSDLTISLCKERYQFVILFNLFFSYLSEIDLIAEQFNQLVGGVIWIIRDGKQYISESLKIECQDTEETGKFIDEYIIQYFSYNVVVSFIDGRKKSTRRNPPTCCKSLTSFIT